VPFVAEKRAAIEAATDRLAAVGLDRLVLDVHEQKIDKRRLARRLQEDLDRAATQPVPEVAHLHHRLVMSRARLPSQPALAACPRSLPSQPALAACLGVPDWQDRSWQDIDAWTSAMDAGAEVDTAQSFVASRLGLDPTDPITSRDWLCLTGQSLLEVTAGQVFTDNLGVLTDLRAKLTWYPDDVWSYVVAADWIRLGEDLPLLGRAGHRDDDLGSRVVAARIVNTAMHLAFLLSRRWAPYPKWLGTMFAQLPVPIGLPAALTAVLTAEHWPERQDAVAQALDHLHQAQRIAGLPSGEQTPTEPFFDRPFLGIRASVPDLLLNTITDPFVRALPPGVGSVEQWVDNVRVLKSAPRRVHAAQCYLAAASHPAT
jgi:hypothetical protein